MKLKKTLSLFLAAVMCMSTVCTPAFAAGAEDAPDSPDSLTVTIEVDISPAISTETDEDGRTTTTTVDTEVSEDGMTTTTTTGTVWSGPNTENTTVEGTSVTTETTITDDEGRIVQETGTEEGAENTTTTETQTAAPVIEDKGTVTETVTGDTTVSETPGEFEPVDSAISSGSEAVDPVFTDGSEVTVELTPGTSATGTAAVDKKALAEQLVRPDAEDSDITDPDTGETVGHRTVTVEDVLDEDGAVIGFTSTSTEETSVTVTNPDIVSSAAPLAIPAAREPVTDADGVTTSMEVLEVYDEAGNLTGYTTIETRTSSTETDSSETVLPERPMEYEDIDLTTGETTAVTVSELLDDTGNVTGYEVTTIITDSEGNVHTSTETLRGTKNTTTATEITDVTTTTIIFAEVSGSSVTKTTKTTTTETKKIVASDRVVAAEMGNVTAGENAGIIETVGVKIEVAEPDVGKTDQKTDLYHRADKDGIDFDPAGFDFQWLGEYGLESAIRVDAVKVNEDGTTTASDKWQAHQFVLVDKDGNEHTVYCADFAVSPQAGFRYDMENVEDAGYYDSEAAAHIRAIAQKGYWGAADGAGSLDAVKRMLAEAYHNGEIDKDSYGGLATAWGFDTYLTDGMALAATQAAIWTYGNSGNLMIDQSDPFTSYYQAISGKNWRGLDSREWALTKALYDYLIAQSEAPTHKNTLINENNFATSASLTVGERDEDSGKYEADVTFTLAVMPDTESDDLLVHVVVGGEIVETRRLAGDDSETQYGVIPRSEDGSYTLSGLKLADGINIDLQLTGTQNIGEGVYLFTSEVCTESVGYDHGEPVFSSQTFVGIESGRQSVDLSVSLNFSVAEATASVDTDSSTVTERKTDTTSTTRTDTTTTTGGQTETAVTVSTTEENCREWVVNWERNYEYPDPEPEVPDEPTPKPEEPDTPDEPEQPDTPDAPEPPVPDTPDTPDEPEQPVEDIPDVDVPLTEPPVDVPDEPAPVEEIPVEEPPVVDIPNEDIPLTDTPAEVPDEPAESIPETDIPLADVPQTGDISGLWYILFAVSCAGLLILAYIEIASRKKTID